MVGYICSYFLGILGSIDRTGFTQTLALIVTGTFRGEGLVFSGFRGASPLPSPSCLLTRLQLSRPAPTHLHLDDAGSPTREKEDDKCIESGDDCGESSEKTVLGIPSYIIGFLGLA